MSIPQTYDAIRLEEFINQRLIGNYSSVQTQIEELMTNAKIVLRQCGDKLREVEASVANHEERITQRVAESNETRDVVIEHHRVILEQGAATGEHHRAINEMYNGIQAMKVQIDSDFAGQIELLQQTSDMEIEKLNLRITTDFEAIKVKLQKGFDEAVSGGNISGERFGEGRTEGRTKHDKKDLAVWKLAEDVSKGAFRHWVEAVGNNLEGIHGWSYPDVILDLVRRQNTVITKESLAEIVRKSSDELAEN